jgi:hypothetical protein
MQVSSHDFVLQIKEQRRLVLSISVDHDYYNCKIRIVGIASIKVLFSVVLLIKN